MSYTITTDIFCDWCPMWMEEGGITGIKPKHRQAEEKAEHFGWKVLRKPKRHVCPKCWNEKKSMIGRGEL